MAERMDLIHRLEPQQIPFDRYEQRMRPHVQAQQKNARGFAKSFVSKSPLGSWFNIERGEFREVSAEATAITLAALYEGLALLFFVDPQAIRWADQAETSVRLLLCGLQRSSS